MVFRTVELNYDLRHGETVFKKNFRIYNQLFKVFTSPLEALHSNLFVKWFTLFLILFFTPIISAQQKSIDTNYVQDLSDSLLIRTGLFLKFTSIKIDENSSNSNLTYEPNTGFDYGLGFAYKSIGLNIAFRVPGSRSPIGQKSKGLDFRLNSYGRRFGFDLAYTSLSGFALKEFYSISGTRLINFRPDLHSTRFSFSSFYNLKPSKFSLRAITLQNERQLKSAGTPIIGVYLNHITFETKDSTSILELTPTESPNEGQSFPDNLYFKKIRSFNVGANLGFMYTLVIKKRFFTSLGVNLGIGYDNSVYSYEGKSDLNLPQLQFFATGRFAIGYNTDNLYIGFFTYTSQSIVDIEKYTVTFEQGMLNLVFAKRFSGKFKLFNKLFNTKFGRIFTKKK